MFFRMIRGTLLRQWKKMILIAITIALGASLATAMLSVVLDVGDKINQELKTYGANITVVRIFRKRNWERSRPFSGHSISWIMPPS